LITVIAVLISLVLLVAKMLADSSDKRVFLRISKLLVWFIIPLVVLFFVSVTLRVANNIPNLPLVF
jgi:hypothetical protein